MVKTHTHTHAIPNYSFFHWLTAEHVQRVTLKEIKSLCGTGRPISAAVIILPSAHLPSPLQLEIEGFVVQNVIKEMGRITTHPSPDYPTAPYDNPSTNQGFPLLAHANL